MNYLVKCMVIMGLFKSFAYGREEEYQIVLLNPEVSSIDDDSEGKFGCVTPDGQAGPCGAAANVLKDNPHPYTFDWQHCFRTEKDISPFAYFRAEFDAVYTVTKVMLLPWAAFPGMIDDSTITVSGKPCAQTPKWTPETTPYADGDWTTYSCDVG